MDIQKGVVYLVYNKKQTFKLKFNIMKNLVNEVVNDFKVFNNYQKLAFGTMIICTMVVILCGLSLICAMLFNGVSGGNIPFL